MIFGQFLIEFLVEGFFYLVTSKSLGQPRTAGDLGLGLPVLYLFIGGLLGAGSIALFPRAILTWEWLRVANLMVTPVLIGWIGTLFVASPIEISKATQFWNGFLFALALTGVRFACAAR